jgi:hypothetical protein
MWIYGRWELTVTRGGRRAGGMRATTAVRTAAGDPDGREGVPDGVHAGFVWLKHLDRLSRTF